MKVISVNVSPGRVVEYRGMEIETGIYKEPVSGPVVARALGLEGDRQVDRRYHGGEDKAVYSYATEDYAWWSGELGRTLGPGAFGENLTTEGLDESRVRPGDTYRFGKVLLQAVDPRQPCRTLAMKFDDAKLPKRFIRKGRFGIYWRVLEEGPVAAGDAITPLHVAKLGESIAEMGARLAKKA